MAITETPNGALVDERGTYMVPHPRMIELGYMAVREVGGEPAVFITPSGEEFLKAQLMEHFGKK